MTHEKTYTYEMCWFCKIKKRCPNDAAVEVTLYKEPIAGNTAQQRKHLSVTIPRCNKCRKSHEGITGRTHFSMMLGTIGGFAGLGLGVRIGGSQEYWCTGLLFGGIAFAALAALFWHRGIMIVAITAGASAVVMLVLVVLWTRSVQQWRELARDWQHLAEGNDGP